MRGINLGFLNLTTDELGYLDRDGNEHLAYCKTSMWTGVYMTRDEIVRYGDAGDRKVESLADENRRLREELASMITGPMYCQGCGTCLPSCPAGVDVPNLMRAYMYAEGYGNAIEASDTLAALPAARGLDVCESCPACTASCTRGIDIGSRVAGLARMELRRC